MTHITVSDSPAPSVVRALRRAGAAHLLAAIRRGAGDRIPWGAHGPHGRVFVTRRSTSVASGSYITTLWLDRVPVWEHRDSWRYQGWEGEAPRYLQEGWLDPSAARAAREESRAAARAAQEGYEALLVLAQRLVEAGVPLLHQEGQEGGILFLPPSTVTPSPSLWGGFISMARAVSTRGLYKRIHGELAPWWEVERWARSLSQGGGATRFPRQRRQKAADPAVGWEAEG